MTKNIVQLKHHFDDYECMWNGIEDLYINQTGEQLPPSFFFVLAGFGSFCYMKTNKDEFKRMVAFGDGRTKKMYEFLAPIVGFEYKHYEHKNIRVCSVHWICIICLTLRNFIMQIIFHFIM